MSSDSQGSLLREDLEQALAADPDDKDYYIRQALQRLTENQGESPALQGGDESDN